MFESSLEENGGKNGKREEEVFKLRGQNPKKNKEKGKENVLKRLGIQCMVARPTLTDTWAKMDLDIKDAIISPLDDSGKWNLWGAFCW